MHLIVLFLFPRPQSSFPGVKNVISDMETENSIHTCAIKSATTSDYKKLLFPQRGVSNFFIFVLILHYLVSKPD